MIQAILCALVAQLLFTYRCTLAAVTTNDEEFFSKVPWLDKEQALAAYRAENKAVELLGKQLDKNSNRLKFYPENRVLIGRTVVVLCLLTPEKENGYRANSVSLQILQHGFTHRRLLLAPTHRLSTPAEQLNCWNYIQESVCQPVRDCNKPSNPGLQTVGIVTQEGWGVFQVNASRTTQAFYQCVSSMQSVLATNDKSEVLKKAEQKIKSSEILQLQVFENNIGEPQLKLRQGYPRGDPLSASCSVPNSSPTGSDFVIELILMRPPPSGTPGASSFELLSSTTVLPNEISGLLNWNGERALLSHHGLVILCRVADDWGDRRRQRVAIGQLQVIYMFPAYFDNPRVRNEMEHERLRAKQGVGYFRSPELIKLRQAEYVVCKADGFPPAQFEWTIDRPHAVWILNETLFISRAAKGGDVIDIKCAAKNSELQLSDTVSAKIHVNSAITLSTSNNIWFLTLLHLSVLTILF